MSDKKKYYWLKLDRNFLKRHDMKILRKTEGVEVIMFYLELMLESVDHEGELKFSENVPYSDEMLAIVLDYKTKDLQKNMKILKKFGLIEILSDGTIFIPQVVSLINSETEAAQRKRKYRENKEKEWDNVPTESQESPKDVLTDVPNDSGNCPIEKEIELEKELEIELEIDKEIEIDGTMSQKSSPNTSPPSDKIHPLKFYIGSDGNLYNGDMVRTLIECGTSLTFTEKPYENQESVLGQVI